LDIGKQLELLIEKKKIPIKKRPYNREFIEDIQDGSLYHEFITSFSTNQAKYVYSFTLNSDGISVCDKSNLSIWPVYLTINELDARERFYIDNVILAGKKSVIFIINTIKLN
jgi:hypothetical protein